ncbi:hypothetical protein AB4170_17775, partial [Vibrio splendidus]
NGIGITKRLQEFKLTLLYTNRSHIDKSDISTKHINKTNTKENAPTITDRGVSSISLERTFLYSG